MQCATFACDVLGMRTKDCARALSRLRGDVEAGDALEGAWPSPFTSPSLTLILTPSSSALALRPSPFELASKAAERWGVPRRKEVVRALSWRAALGDPDACACGTFTACGIPSSDPSGVPCCPTRGWCSAFMGGNDCGEREEGRSRLRARRSFAAGDAGDFFFAWSFASGSTTSSVAVRPPDARSRLGLRTKLATRPMMLLRFSPAGEGRLEEGDDEEGARLKSLCIGSDGGGFAIRRRRLSVASADLCVPVCAP